MRTDTPLAIARSDYRPYPYALTHVRLSFDLEHEHTVVHAELDFRSLQPLRQPLVLHGQDLGLDSIAIDARPLTDTDYDVNDGLLTLYPEKDSFTVSITTTCQPAANSTLMGLYASGATLFTQCEAEGFRRMMWFPDRPDVMSVYQVTLRANKDRYPVLLANGNLVAEQDLGDGRHETVWHDPHPKPSYLFALVAGRFAINQKTLKTASGRSVLLQIYSDPGSDKKTAWALECLERAMRWDEASFGLELDLDRFMIVAARDFNMGAMENKGLNIFNSSYVLACPDSATDQSYRTIEAVIGHEYFHNWTGNRVTCRDWFQLSLKEGLTVFREQEFSADMLAAGLEGTASDSARAVKRIDDVEILRSQQFPEDASPMAHPIRPESYQEISNFYTATIYEKGAEIIRMLHTILTPEGFRAGLREYFGRHDGQAVTCDDFLDAMESAYTTREPGKTLDGFRHWYSQAGTPRVTVSMDYDPAARRCTVHLTQSNPPAGIEKLTEHASNKPPLHIPIAIGFLAADGTPMAVQQNGDASIATASDPKSLETQTMLLELTEASQSWTFDQVESKPVLSLLRGFSAPVIVDYPREQNERVLLALHDTDPFARWEAVQDLATAQILSTAESDARDATAAPLDPNFVSAWEYLLQDPEIASDYRARVLTLPTPRQLLFKVEPMRPLAVSRAYQLIHRALGKALAPSWLTLYERCKPEATRRYDPRPADAASRALRSLALGYLVAAGHPEAYDLAREQYQRANNLTDRLGALGAVTRYGSQDAGEQMLADFFSSAEQDEQLMDHWFSLQANARWATIDTIKALIRHPQFSLRNPNRARSLIFQFCLNNIGKIHTPEGYSFWGDQIVQLDALNPEVAARLARGMDNWAQFAEPHRSAMHKALANIQESPGLSPNVSEIVNKALSI